MFTPEFKNQFSKPEEHKVEVRIMKATSELWDLLDKCHHRFANPIPPTEEGNKLIQEVYPARKAYLEWLQRTKAALERHLEENPMPQISEQWLDEQAVDHHEEFEHALWNMKNRTPVHEQTAGGMTME